VDNTKEYILCAAIWYPEQPTAHLLPVNIKTGIVICGHRHPHCIYTMNALTGKRQAELQPYTQGFLTMSNRFVSRMEAKAIAANAGQLIDNIDNLNGLFSEDIY